MAEKPFTGLTASVKMGANAEAETIGYISGVDLSLEKDIIEILAFGMQYKEKVPAIKDWSASIDGTVALSADGSQKKFYDAFESGEGLTFGIYLDEETYFEGTGFVQSFNISASPDDKISLTAEIAGSNAVTLTISGASDLSAMSTSAPTVAPKAVAASDDK